MDGLRPARVADHVIEGIRAREVRGLIELPARPSLQPGDAVRIVHGPLTGLTGLHAGMRGSERVIVLLQMPGRVELPRDDVEAV